jgi:hypothetical protein
MSLSQQMPPFDWSQLLAGFFVAFLICAVAESPVSAQSAWETREVNPWGSPSPADRESERSRDSRSPEGIPGWAVPSDPGPTSSWGSAGERGRGVQTNNGPLPPNDPNKVPLGGLEWLLAAGLGYGAYRLRGQRDDDAAA